jgi:hypothetical protein
MDSPTKFRLAVASAALAGCAVGAVALGPSFAGALQEDDGTTTTTVEESTDPTTEGGTDETADGERCGPGRFGRPGFEAAAEAIGITEDELREAIVSGQTLAEVAEANGVDPAAVVAAMVAEAEEHLAEAVADGRITQEQADERRADLEQRITDLVNGELELRHPGGRGGPGHRGPAFG